MLRTSFTSSHDGDARFFSNEFDFRTLDNSSIEPSISGHRYGNSILKSSKDPCIKGYPTGRSLYKDLAAHGYELRSDYVESRWMCFVFLSESMTPWDTRRQELHRNRIATYHTTREKTIVDVFRVYCTHAGSRSWMVIRVENEWIARSSDAPWHHDMFTRSPFYSTPEIRFVVKSLRVRL